MCLGKTPRINCATPPDFNALNAILLSNTTNNETDSGLRPRFVARLTDSANSSVTKLTIFLKSEHSAILNLRHLVMEKCCSKREGCKTILAYSVNGWNRLKRYNLNSSGTIENYVSH